MLQSQTPIRTTGVEISAPTGWSLTERDTLDTPSCPFGTVGAIFSTDGPANAILGPRLRDLKDLKYQPRDPSSSRDLGPRGPAFRSAFHLQICATVTGRISLVPHVPTCPLQYVVGHRHQGGPRSCQGSGNQVELSQPDGRGPDAGRVSILAIDSGDVCRGGADIMGMDPGIIPQRPPGGEICVRTLPVHPLDRALQCAMVIRRSGRRWVTSSDGARGGTMWLLTKDIGITVGAVVVPQSMAYAKLALLEPQFGLYSSFMGVLIYWFFATSKDITIGVSPITSKESSRI